MWCFSHLWVNGWGWLAAAHYDLDGGVSWALQIWPQFPSCCHKLNGSHVALKAQSSALVFIWWNGTSVKGNRMCVVCVRERTQWTERETENKERERGKEESNGFICPTSPWTYWHNKWERRWEMIRSCEFFFFSARCTVFLCMVKRPGTAVDHGISPDDRTLISWSISAHSRGSRIS